MSHLGIFTIYPCCTFFRFVTRLHGAHVPLFPTSVEGSKIICKSLSECAKSETKLWYPASHMQHGWSTSVSLPQMFTLPDGRYAKGRKREPPGEHSDPLRPRARASLGAQGTPRGTGCNRCIMPASVSFSEQTPSTACNIQRATALLIQELHQIIATL